MRKALRTPVSRAVAAWLVLSTVQLATGAVAGASAPTVTFRDEFTGGTFAGSHGTGAWATDWAEDDSPGSDPGDGSIQVKSDSKCVAGECLYMGVAGYNASIWRSVDLTGVSSAVLTFQYERHLHGLGLGSLHLRVFNGVGWTQLAVYPLNIDDGSIQSASFDITPYIAANAAIRFELTGNGDDSHMNVDNLQIAATIGSRPVFNQDLLDRTDAEAAVLSISSAATDPGGGTIVYSAVGLPTGITIDSASGLISGTIDYSAAAGSPYAVTVTAAVGALTANDSFAWTIIDTNRPPLAVDDTTSVAEDGPGVVIPVLANDSDPDLDPLAILSLDTGGLVGGSVVNNGDGTITYVPFLNFDGAEKFGYTIHDGKGGSASAMVDVEVNPLPDPPELAPLGTLVGAEESLITCTAVATDPDTDDSITYTLVAGSGSVPPGAAIHPTSGVFTWIPAEEKGPGSYTFAVRATDSTGLFAERPITVVVEESNSPPVLKPIANVTSAEATYVEVTVIAVDPDSPSTMFRFSATGLPPGIMIDAATGKMSGIPSATAAAGSPYTVTVSVTDGGSPPLTDAVSFLWEITNVNRPPVLTGSAGDKSVSVGVPTSFGTIAVTDPDGDPITFSASGLPPGLSINSSTGVVSGTVPVGSGGLTYSVVVTAKDPSGASISDSFTVTVLPEEAPGATSGAAPPPPAETNPNPPRTSGVTRPVGETERPDSIQPTIVAVPETEPVGDPPTPPGAIQSDQFTSKTSLVLTSSDSATSRPEADRSLGLGALDRILVVFGTVVEDLEAQLGSALALGVGISFFAVVGVDRRRKDETPGYRPAFLNTL